MANRGRPPHPDVLTPAEWNVLRHLREGLTNAEIAVRLGISPDGVKYHVSNMLAKSGAPDRHALAEWEPRSPGPRRFGLAGVLAGLGVAGGVVAVAFVGVVAVSLLKSDTDSEAIPDVAATRKVESFVMERTVLFVPSLAGIPSSAGDISLDERVTFQAPERERTEQRLGNRVHIEIVAGMRMLGWDEGDGLALSVEFPSGVQQPSWPIARTLRDVVASKMPLSRAVYKGEGVQAGRTVYLIEGRPVDCGLSSDGRIELAIDEETLFVLREAAYDKDTGEIASLSEVESIQYDVPLDASLFEPPDGLEVVTMETGLATAVVQSNIDTWTGTDSEDCVMPTVGED